MRPIETQTNPVDEMEMQFVWVALLALCSIVSIICTIWILVLAFAEDIFSGLLSLFCGPYLLYYSISRWRRCKVPLLVGTFASLLTLPMPFLIGADEFSERVNEHVDTNQVVTKLREVEKMLETPTERDLKALEGTWAIVVDDSGEVRADSVITIQGDQCVATFGEESEKYLIAIRPDEGGGEIDLTSLTNAKTTEGLYRIEEDTLTICLSEPGQKRPSTLETQEGVQWTFQLRKQQP